MDIVEQAMSNLYLKETGGDIEGFVPVKWQMTQEIFEYLRRKFIRIGGWDRELDRHIKKLLFRVDKGIQVLLVLYTYLDHPFTTISLKRLHNHGTPEIINDFSKPHRISGNVCLRDDILEVEDIELAVGQDLTGCAVDHKDLVAHRR